MTLRAKGEERDPAESGRILGAIGALRVEEALRLALEAAPRPKAERVPLGNALGRVLAEEARARVDQPPFDKSTMDGFAHASPLPAPEGPWRVIGLAAAGSSRLPALGPGECVRIMTGAIVPPGTEAVQRVEWTEALSPPSPGLGYSALVRFTRAEEADNLVRRAANRRAGELLLGPRVLGPQDIGILASSGYEGILVAERPRVAVLSTGDELATPGSPLGPGAVYDSNGPQLAAQAMDCGCDASFLGIARDDEDSLFRAFEAALRGRDVLIVSGGVSMGDFDCVPRALARAGIEEVFHGLAMKPGKPVFFGTRRRGAGARASAAVFGLPGNPVSSFVAFEMLVRPYLAARSGLAWKPRIVGARLASAVTRKESDRHEFLPARLEPGADGLPSVRPLEYKGSSMLSVLGEADCLLSIAIGVEGLEEGSVVNARLVRP
jgi:molybdopterin molybdotransferase